MEDFGGRALADLLKFFFFPFNLGFFVVFSRFQSAHTNAMSKLPEDNVNATVLLSDQQTIKEKAKACGGEYYTVNYKKVKNPLSMQEKEQIMHRLKEEFRKVLDAAPPAQSEELLRESYVQQAKQKGDNRMVEFITETHPTLATMIMSRDFSEERWKILLRLVFNIKFDRSEGPTEDEKVKAHVQLHKDVLRSCGITSFDKE